MPNFTTETLREGLIEDLAALRKGKMRASEARARAYLAKQIIETVKIEAVAEHLRLEKFQPVSLLPAERTIEYLAA